VTRTAESGLETYLKDINETPLLNAEQEKELARAIQKGCPIAREALIKSNLRLVVAFARRYMHFGVPIEDIISAGNLGLIRGVEAFDPDKGCRFSTYGGLWILQAMKRLVDNQAPLVPVPSYISRLLLQWKRVAQELNLQLGREPNSYEIARRLNIPLRKIPDIEAASLAYRLPSDDNPPCASEEKGLVNLTGSEIRPEDNLENNESYERVLTSVERLPDLERAVLTLRYGLNGNDEHTAKELSVILGMTAERVKELEKRGVRFLADELSN
jgi:RNA polymerase primary sigma factor